MSLSQFEKKCLSLNIGYDHDLCDGKYCEKRMTCVRYMLHKKWQLDNFAVNLTYVKKTYNDKCYLKYEETTIVHQE